MILFLMSLSYADEFLQVREKVRHGAPLQEAILSYVHMLEEAPDPAVYRALSSLLEIEEKPLCAQAAKIRAQNMEFFTPPTTEGYVPSRVIWLWLGVLVCYILWFIWPNRVYVALLFGSCISALYFFPQYRYKGKIIYENTPAVHIPSLAGVEMINLEKGAVVDIVGAQQGFWKVSLLDKQGWVHRESVVSWDPYDVFKCFDT